MKGGSRAFVYVFVHQNMLVSHVASVKLRDADGRGEAAATPRWKLKYLITWVLLLFAFYKHLPAMWRLALWDLFAKWEIYLHLESA